MSTAKEIRTKIVSVKSTQKITRAMELVAASKMRKARDRMEASRSYAERMRVVIGHVAKASTQFPHPFLIERSVRRVGFIVIATDRGLCGGLNIHAFKKAVEQMHYWEQQGCEIDLAIIGAKGENYFKHIKANIVAYAHHLGEQPKIEDLIGAVKVMIDSYDKGQIDRLYLVGNEFINTISQKPKITQILPLEPVDETKLDYHWDYIYEPDSQSLLDMLLGRYIESQVYQGVVENLACEQASRMIAMKNATDNAGEFISDLQLQFNKARQAAITRELAEIVSGSAAV